MDIPSDLVNQAGEGRLVLLLGAGASLGSKTSDGYECPTTAKLGRLLSTKLLGGYLQDGPLSQIAELAISETDLGRLHTLIRDTFQALQPTAAAQTGQPSIPQSTLAQVTWLYYAHNK